MKDDNKFSIDFKSKVFNVPGVIFIYWDKKARVLEFLFFESKAKYFYIP